MNSLLVNTAGARMMLLRVLVEQFRNNKRISSVKTDLGFVVINKFLHKEQVSKYKDKITHNIQIMNLETIYRSDFEEFSSLKHSVCYNQVFDMGYFGYLIFGCIR